MLNATPITYSRCVMSVLHVIINVWINEHQVHGVLKSLIFLAYTSCEVGKEIKSVQYIHHLTNLINFPYAISNCVIENGSGSNRVVCKTKSMSFFILLIYISDSLNYYKNKKISHAHTHILPKYYENIRGVAYMQAKASKAL